MHVLQRVDQRGTQQIHQVTRRNYCTVTSSLGEESKYSRSAVICLSMSEKRTPFDEIMRRIEDMVEQMVEDMGIDSDMFKPSIYGFSIIQSEGGKPEVHEFGFSPDGSGVLEPFVDVVESESQVHVMMELADVKEEDISTRCSGTRVTVRVEARGGVEQSYNVELPAKVDPESSRVTYNNGLLEITLDKIKDDSRDVSIE